MKPKSFATKKTAVWTILLVLLMIGVVVSRSDRTEYLSKKEPKYTGLDRYRNKRVGSRARDVAHSWKHASKDTGRLHKTMKRFGVKIHPTDDYLNYCRLKKALSNCETNGGECRDECRN
jgi:hypothetical protein